ncbi:MAG: hypothetical protein WDN06_00580 [Asticcacaulis sp.]
MVGAQIIGTVIEAAPSATAMGSQLSISLCQLGSTTRSEVVRLEYATGLSMYGANPVIDQNRNLRAPPLHRRRPAPGQPRRPARHGFRCRKSRLRRHHHRRRLDLRAGLQRRRQLVLRLI